MNYILLTEKTWHDELFEQLAKRDGENWRRVKTREDFNAEFLADFQPTKIFIPHWSYIIPATIFDEHECVVFHMTDLPYGRGGSPLQNLIVRGHKDTRISAIKVSDGIDTGPVYLKSPLSLEGTAHEIFERMALVIGNMIGEIIDQDLLPEPQEGEVVSFKRRKPADGNIDSLEVLNQVYDHIRMLDCEGYPPAFLESTQWRIEFDNAYFAENGDLQANVRITKK